MFVVSPPETPRVGSQTTQRTENRSSLFYSFSFCFLLRSPSLLLSNSLIPLRSLSSSHTLLTWCPHFPFSTPLLLAFPSPSLRDPSFLCFPSLLLHTLLKCAITFSHLSHRQFFLNLECEKSLPMVVSMFE
ncbi:hypothetical protein L6164_008722 [Bauhinia variegata]|uniref:Uncharacterized protein n=1 Tax=Bauhinia variegata TaxID=167791 RepID=A0ACB9PHD6_BAUVA|nr:hypothetical protein L6164_008722 [Bauhinia variegata]